MIDTYLIQLEQLFQQFPNIQTYTLTKKVYNTKQGFISGSIFFENGYRLDFVEVKNTDVQAKIKYRYQYMDRHLELVFRYDNAPHHKHLQQGKQESEEPTLGDVLMEIAATNLKRDNL